MATSPQESGLLSGIRVLEAASMIMVPSVGAALADYGAEVIKLEPIEGDLNRRGHQIPGMPVHDYEYCFLPDNRGKRSLSIDLKAPEARGILRRLVENADVFLTNHRPKSLAGLGLGWPELQAINPRLVYAHGTGFGDAGEEIDKPGFDTVCYWSRSGMEANMFPLEGWLGSLGYGTGDQPTGMALFSAVLLALLARERTGRGTRVSCSLLASGAWSNAVMLQAKLLGAQFLERQPREDARSFTSVYYRAGDQRLFKMTVVDTRRDWPKVCRALGRPELASDPRYATLEERVKEGRMRELIQICDEIFASRPMAHWRHALEAADVPYSVIATFDDVVADPQMAANGVFVEIDDPVLGRVRTVDTPLKVEGHPKVKPTPAPRLGEHTRAILAEIGLGQQEIDTLAERRVVAERALPSAPVPGPQ
ncbi:MAG: CoA transferase [Betaproteobacteria bacterium]|nr:CoA transferase [Betaproteobacteria bacterium]